MVYKQDAEKYPLNETEDTHFNGLGKSIGETVMILSAFPVLLPVLVALPFCGNIFKDDESSSTYTNTGTYVVGGIVVAATLPVAVMAVPVCALGILAGGAIYAVEN